MRGLFHRVPHRGCHLGGAFGVGAEAHAAAVDVGAADVELDPAHLGAGVKAAAGLHIFLDGKTADVCQDRLVKDLCQLRQFLPDHRVHAGVLQAHGVEKPRGGLRDAGRGIAEAGVQGRSLAGEGAETVDVVELRKLVPVAEAAAGGDDGVT